MTVSTIPRRTGIYDVPFVSVTDPRFGARGDGVTDDTAAIQAALNAANRVYAPAGTYKFTNLTIPVNCYLFGDGDTATIFTTATTGNAFQFTTSTSHRVTLKDFTLQQSGSVQGNGIAMDDCYWWVTENIHIKGFVNNVYASRSIYHTHKRLFSETTTNGVNYWGSAGVWNTAWFNNVITFDTCRLSDFTVTGVAVKGAEVIFLNPDFSNGAIGAKVYGESAAYPAHGVQIVAPYIELTQIGFSFQYASAQIDAGGFVQGGVNLGGQFTSIIDADNSTVYWNGKIRDQDYWANGYRLTNSSALTFRSAGFTGSIRATAGTADATSKVLLNDYDEGTFTATLNGCTTSPTATAYYVRNGKHASVSIPQLSATSNATTCGLSGLPAALYPTREQLMYGCFFDNGAEAAGIVRIQTDGTINFYPAQFASNFAAAGVKGSRTLTLSYPIC
jgi:hypothetical protein